MEKEIDKTVAGMLVITDKVLDGMKKIEIFKSLRGVRDNNISKV